MDVKEEDGRLVVTVPVSDEDGVRKLVGALGFEHRANGAAGPEARGPGHEAGPQAEDLRDANPEGLTRLAGGAARSAITTAAIWRRVHRHPEACNLVRAGRGERPAAPEALPRRIGDHHADRRGVEPVAWVV